jgi:hypothetical protein
MYSCRFNFSSLHNWMDAKAHHDSIKPIRTDGVRPIGNRRKKEANIREEADAIICRLYETDVVTYHKDGRIEVRLDGWMSQSTAAFISAALEPTGLRHNQMWITATTGDTYTGGWLALDPNEVNTFVRTGSGDLKFLNPTPTKVHTVNRARTNNVRRQYKPFLDYIKNVVKLRGEFEGTNFKRVTCSTQEYKDVFGTRTDFIGDTNLHTLPCLCAKQTLCARHGTSRAVVELGNINQERGPLQSIPVVGAVCWLPSDQRQGAMPFGAMQTILLSTSIA